MWPPVFLYSLRTTNGFYIFNWLERKKNQYYFPMWKLDEIQMSASVSEVSLARGYARLFMYCLQMCLLPYDFPNDAFFSLTCSTACTTHI